MEVGRATFETKRKRFTILDCPGHKNYVTNMISGAAQADVACLVVSARVGEFEAGFERTGQTREHAMLAKSLGATKMIVLINKLDTVKWSQARYDYIKDNLSPFLVKACGFEAFNIYWVGIEGLTGYNIINVGDKEEANWYKGMSLFDTLDSFPLVKRS